MVLQLKRTGYIGVCVVILFTAWAFLFCTSYRPILPGYHAFYYTPAKYQSLKQELEQHRLQCARVFKRGKSSNEDELTLNIMRRDFRKNLMEKVFPFWYGTRWSFNGTSEVPGESSIACGYFVTTVLRDAGCRINRSKLAQASSEDMIKTLVREKFIRRFSDTPYSEFVEAMKKEGPGIFVVGLDKHTGFWVNDKDRSYFIHASGFFPFAVVQENGEDSGVVRKSKYRVVGLLTKDSYFMKNWLMQ